MKKISAVMVLLLCLLCLQYYSAKSLALYSYSVSESIGTYSTITGTALTSGDDASADFTLPFTFNYDGVNYTSVHVCTNGWLSFNTSAGNSLSGPPGTYSDIIAWMFGDLYVQGSVSWTTIGSSPSRVVVVQWATVTYYPSGSGGPFNAQIKLYEGSNQVEIVYGAMSGFSTNNCYAYLSGTAASTYINIQPGSPSTFYQGNNGNPFINSSYSSYLVSGKTYTFSTFAYISTLYPQQLPVLALGQIYSTPPQKPGFMVGGRSGATNYYISYKISGPGTQGSGNPDWRQIYTVCRSTDTTKEYINVSADSMRFSFAKGIGARVEVPPGNDGALDLRNPLIRPGLYTIEAVLTIRASQNAAPTYTSPTFTSNFVIARERDFAIDGYPSPRRKSDRKYAIGSLIPIQVKVVNLGQMDVDSFRLINRLYRQDTILMRTDTFNYPVNYTDPPLVTSDYYVVDLPSFNYALPGIFRLESEATPLGFYDQDLTNNIYPRAGDTLRFQTSLDFDAQADSVISPRGKLYVGRPVNVTGQFSNNGISIISDAPASMKIYKNVGGVYNQIVYQSNNYIIPDLPVSHPVTVRFPIAWAPPSPGLYKAVIEVDLLDDPVASNNQAVCYFEVIASLEGLYTIGTTNAADTLRNFTTIQGALNALYLLGISDSVIFELTDSTYTVGSPSSNNPAIDLTGKLIGVEEGKTITFRPGPQRRAIRGGVQINMTTGSGIGVQLGQNLYPSNMNSAIYVVSNAQRKNYANNDEGRVYVTFDGGQDKAFQFRLSTNRKFRSAFYLSQGASNVSIKNCLITDISPLYKDTIPRTFYNTAFIYQSDTSASWTTGILMRSVAPLDPKSSSNALHIDTLFNQDNIISKNEISGFGYGIVSLGAGVLLQQGNGLFERYYNKNNTILGNIISNIGRAGIFLGSEYNTSIVANRIYSVGGSRMADTTEDAAGIIIGGEGSANYFGYNNMKITIDRNEIQGISGKGLVYGIKDEQDRVAYPHPSGIFIIYPDETESTIISNNMIWGLTQLNPRAIRFGIRLFTQRSEDINRSSITNFWNSYLRALTNPKDSSYRTRDDKIANNTVVLADDPSSTAIAAIAGIAVQSGTGTILKNNAIAVQDNGTVPDSSFNTGVFYQGPQPSLGYITSDFNAYELSSNTSVFRFMETDSRNNTIERGIKTDHFYLGQLQSSTGSDFNSSVGNFTNDMELLGTAPSQKYRVRLQPETPIGSILNNRGERLSFVTLDIDSVQRGAGLQKYDIGACEFVGRMYFNDIEVVAITSPAAYRSSTGFFSDAEYIMTQRPVTISAKLRNNASVLQSGIRTTLKIFRELPNGTFSNQANDSITVFCEIPTNEILIRDFPLADSLIRTYNELGTAYSIPLQFSSMALNITPRYKFATVVEGDQNNLNDYAEKICRFYFKRSILGMLVSAENSYATINASSTTDLKACRLNFDTLMVGLTGMGWIVNMNNPDSTVVDIFDRTGWEAKAVNYPLYRTMFWTDGDERPMTRLQRDDIRDFISSGTLSWKKNLIISSQEMVRLNGRVMTPPLPETDTLFTNEILRATYCAPGNPRGASGSYHNKRVMGVAVGNQLIEYIKNTTFTGDPDPMCGLVGLYSTSTGTTSVAYRYLDGNQGRVDTAGVASTNVFRNVIYMGVDWRHWTNIRRVMMSILDYLDNNGGRTVDISVPLELTEFDAFRRGDRVELNWKTFDEQNVDRFEIEKANISQKSLLGNIFEKVNTIQSHGLPFANASYGPIYDRNVSSGNIYSYRLKMIDKDGSYKNSNEVEVRFDSDNYLGLSAPVPNPSTGDFKLTYSVSTQAFVRIEVIDMTGRLISVLFDGSSLAGSHELDLNLNNIPSGNYNIIMTSGSQTFTQTLKIVK